MVKDILAKNNVTTLERHPYFFLTWLQLIFTCSVECKQHWRDATNTIKNATEKLKRLSQNAFQECFQHLFNRWQKCIFAQRGLFWMKCSLNDCIFVFLRSKVVPGKFWSYYVFVEREIFQTKAAEKIKAHNLCSITPFFPRKSFRLWDNVEIMVQPSRSPMTV
jgi:hypothetical protein